MEERFSEQGLFSWNELMTNDLAAASGDHLPETLAAMPFWVGIPVAGITAGHHLQVIFGARRSGRRKYFGFA